MSELFSFDSTVKTNYSHPILELYRDKINKKLDEEIASLDRFQKDVCAVPIDKSVKVIANAGCLTGDSEIRFNRAGKSFKMSLSKAYSRWVGERHDKLENRILWNKDVPTKVRSLQDNGVIKLHPIGGIVESGVKPIYELTLEDGKKIKGTPCHKIRTNKGWVPLGELTENDIVLVDNQSRYQKTSLGIKREKIQDYERTVGGFHPFARISKSGLSYAKRVSIHRLIFEANKNNLSLEEFIIATKDKGKCKSLFFIDSSKYHLHHKDENHYNNCISNLELMDRVDHLKHHSKGFSNFKYGTPTEVKVSKVIDPMVNQDADAWAVYYRNVHDLIVADNKTNGIYIHRKATAVA